MRRKIKVNQEICELAYKHGWKRLWKKEGVVRFERNGVTCDICLTTLTMTTELDHPKLGHTILLRKKLGRHSIEKVLANPRAHTGAGKIIGDKKY